MAKFNDSKWRRSLVSEHKVSFTKEDMDKLHNDGEVVKKDSEGKDHTYTYSEQVGEGKLTEGKKISFRDMGISNLMDLKLYTDKLAKANIGWDQKGQALVFNNTNDAKKARQLLGLDESKLNEEYVESMDAVRLDKHLKEIEKLWKAWKKGPYTERDDIKPAGDELTHYILLWMRKTFK